MVVLAAVELLHRDGVLLRISLGLVITFGLRDLLGCLARAARRAAVAWSLFGMDLLDAAARGALGTEARTS